MSFAFDLISDLHIETWPTFDWTAQATSPYCIVAGDIGRDRKSVIECLRHLGHCYQAVFYVDGNDEHYYNYEALSESYKDLVNKIKRLPNVIYLQDNVVVIDGVAILGTNGWWTFDSDRSMDPMLVKTWVQDKYNLSSICTDTIEHMGTTDAAYMINSVKRMQTHKDVKKIVCVTHTVPDSDLIKHDIDLCGHVRFNTMSNNYMQYVLDADTEKKLHTWCFGHYHGSIDQTKHGIKFINNCRGRGDTQYRKWVYHPLRIEIDIS
jgi:hypothetical protein